VGEFVFRMATHRLKRPRDPIQLGKLIVDIATGQVEVSILSAPKRKQIARTAAKARWLKREPTN
jgi:hypothetical protein